MKFRTEITAPRYPFRITYDSRLMFLGSCFSEHAAAFFSERRFSVCDNPFGILFNPFSIAQGLDILTERNSIPEKSFQFFNEKWMSFLHHGKFSHPDKKIFLQNINNGLEEGRNFLQNADILFITFGTSYYYYHLEKEMVVANCHKVPAAEFEKRRCDILQISDCFSPFFEWKKKNNPALKVIFTVSPVRHLADGFHENQVSKAILHLAVEKMCAEQEDAFYFPSYEIFMDDLRDYRFYDKDLCHPSAQGIEYVDGILMESFFSEETQKRVKEVEKEVKREAHRPLFSKSENSHA